MDASDHIMSLEAADRKNGKQHFHQGLPVSCSEAHPADRKTEMPHVSFNVLPLENGWTGLVHMRISMIAHFFLSWNPLVASVCAAEGDTHYLIPDSFRS